MAHRILHISTNFSIVAHIDHSSDRILELTHTPLRTLIWSRSWTLWTLNVSIRYTIKSNAVHVMYDADDGERYQFQLIDTSRPRLTLPTRFQGLWPAKAVLVVDATPKAWGKQSQTLCLRHEWPTWILFLQSTAGLIFRLLVLKEVRAEVRMFLQSQLILSPCVFHSKTGEGIHNCEDFECVGFSSPKV